MYQRELVQKSFHMIVNQLIPVHQNVWMLLYKILHIHFHLFLQFNQFRQNVFVIEVAKPKLHSKFMNKVTRIWAAR